MRSPPWTFVVRGSSGTQQPTGIRHPDKSYCFRYTVVLVENPPPSAYMIGKIAVCCESCPMPPKAEGLWKHWNGWK